MEKIKDIMKNVKLWIGIVLVIGVIAIVMIVLQKPKFEVTNFSIESKTTEYTSITNSTTYTGTGLITTQDKKGTYAVAVKIVLKSGGSEDSEKEHCTMVMVNNGKGEFGTYDYGNVGSISKPEYDFEILGYVKF